MYNKVSNTPVCVRLPVRNRTQTGAGTGREEKEKKDKRIRGIQFLPTDFQKDKRGKLCSIVF